ncbi:MAG TPA: 16S rRNA (adenine(1518)-N(6)/adenine(1519)-N(6))-dimethyltransferase RsmA [Blastocatellia bacterium]|nr:16S rRNA (adenine(1518)-N(6)/adenine(1519)-N(6))-dimethyltransferase RsmA [Blastocatellia bacterium]
MHAKKSLGQNFLVGTHYPNRILASVAPQPDETILEIGPGHGALTGLLVATNANIIAIELDRELIPELTERFADAPNFRLVEADALEVNCCELMQPAATARVVANLPYYISTAILQRLIAHRACIREMTLMLQREVVERMVAKPGGKEYGYLAALVQFYCETKKLFDVPPGAFRPVPKVTSSVVQLRVREHPVADVTDEAFFLEMLSAIFAQRRKTLWNNLRAAKGKFKLDDSQLRAALEAAHIDAQRRAETLTLEETARLSNHLKELA